MNHMNDINPRTTPGRFVQPQPRQGLVLTAVAFLVWAVCLVFYPVSDNGTTSNLAGLALTGLCISPALVIIGARVAVGVRPKGWNLQPAWLTGPIIAAMLLLSIGAAATDAPRPAVAVAAAALLVLAMGFIAAASQHRSIDTHQLAG